MKETKNTNSKSKKENQIKLQKNKLEWTVFAISAVLLLGLIVYLAYSSFSQKISTPDLKISYSKDPSPHSPYRYKIQLENLGSETAEDVIIEAALMKADSLMESSELQIAFSPKLSIREGWINFISNPELADSITIRVASYKKP